MIASCAPCAAAVRRASSRRAGGTAATTGRSTDRWSPQLAALACGSRSTTAVRQPEASAALARLTLSVVLPVPPFRGVAHPN